MLQLTWNTKNTITHLKIDYYTTSTITKAPSIYFEIFGPPALAYTSEIYGPPCMSHTHTIVSRVSAHGRLNIYVCIEAATVAS